MAGALGIAGAMRPVMPRVGAPRMPLATIGAPRPLPIIPGMPLPLAAMPPGAAGPEALAVSHSSLQTCSGVSSPPRTFARLSAKRGPFNFNCSCLPLSLYGRLRASSPDCLHNSDSRLSANVAAWDFSPSYDKISNRIFRTPSRDALPVVS